MATNVQLDQVETPVPVVEQSTVVEDKRSAEEQTKILAEAGQRFRASTDDDKKNIDASKEDIKFVFQSGAQWDEEVKRRWGSDPVLEFPQLKQFVNQVVNDQRQNRPGIRVHPAGAKSSAEVAELLQGLVRGIENASQAEAVYDTGYQHAVVGGRGFWRVLSEYEKPDSFNQVLRIRAIVDPSTVRMDLEFQEPDASDCNYYFILERMQKEAFEKRWPEANSVSWQPDGDTSYWYDGKDTITVADYYRRVSVRRTLVMLVDGTQGFKDEVEKKLGFKLRPEMIKADRETDDYKVEWFKVAGGEQILEEYEWPGRTIPVICDMGDNIMIDGKRVFQGLIRQARDAQRMYNYEKSLKALLISMYPLAPFIANDEAIEGRETMWDNANKGRYSTLVYNAKDENGNPIPSPQRMQFGAVPAALSEAMASDKEDMKSVIGMYDPSLGQHSNETSGRAILAREKQGDTGTFHFADNHARAIALTGRICIEVMPTYYDTQRLAEIIKPDDTHEMVVLNQQGLVQSDNGELIKAIIKNDITTGEYGVTVEAGPSYATAREQTRDYMMQLVQSDPSVLQIGGDIIVKAMDFPDSDDLAERMQLMMPPPIQQHIAQKGKGQKVPPEVTQQMGQMQQEIEQGKQVAQQLQQENQQLKSGAAQKMEAAQIDAKTTMDKAQLDAKTELDKAMIAAATTVAVKMLEISSAPTVDAAGVPVEGAPIDSPQEELVEGELPQQEQQPEPILMLAQQIAEMARVLAMPRRSVLEMDENGEVTGTVSMPHDSGTIQ